MTHRVVCLLEILRGAARGGTYAAQAPVYAALVASQGPLLALAHAFRQNAAVICLILKLAGNVVEGHVPYLDVSHTYLPPPYSLQLPPDSVQLHLIDTHKCRIQGACTRTQC